MKRVFTEVKIDDTHTRLRAIVEDEASEEGTDAVWWRQREFLHVLAENPPLLALGAHHFQTLTISHDGHKWVATAQATVEA